MEVFRDLLVRECATRMEEASNSIARAIAALDPNADEKKIASTIDSFCKKLRDVLPEMVVAYQSKIKELQNDSSEAK